MNFDGMHAGLLTSSSTYTTLGDTLPNARVGDTYGLWLHIVGGLRDISATSEGLPAGLSGTISGDPRGYITGLHGNHFFLIQGTPAAPGLKTVDIRLTDARSTTRNIAVNLPVEPLPLDGLIARYKFERNTQDGSGNGHHANNFGARFVADRHGRANSALAFDGVNDYLILPHEEVFDLREFTIIAVLKLPNLRSGDDWIISKGTRFGNFTVRRAGSSGPWQGYATYVHQSLTGNWSSVASETALPVNRFFCLAISVSDRQFNAYVDGRLVRQVSNPASRHYNDKPVTVGAGGYYRRTEYLKGIIDELEIYRGALDNAAIARICQGF
jgi:hypothetical protein